MGDVTLNGASYVLDGSGDGLRGTHSRQDITPTFVQATEGSAGDTDVQPFAEIVYSSLNGSLGLFDRTAAPGDLSRLWVSDLDNTRPNQLTAWPQYGGATTVTVPDSGSAARKCLGITGLVQTASGWGFIGFDNTALTYWYYTINGSSSITRSANRVQHAPANPFAEAGRLWGSSNTYNAAGIGVGCIVQQTGTNLWLPGTTTNTCTDISVAPVAGVGVGDQCVFVYFDILFTVSNSVSAGNLTITPYRPNTPAAGNVVNAIKDTGYVAATATIPGESVCLGAVPCEGAVYLTTDHSVYAMQWNDKDNSILTTKLFELPIVTGAPVAWNGEVYIPAGNRIAHITPGQRGYDWKQIDALGCMPMPWQGNIIQLLPFPDCLLAQLGGESTTLGGAILRMDVQGAWSTIYLDKATNFYGPLVPIIDTVYGSGVGVQTTSTLSALTIFPIPASGWNPRFATDSTRRKQRAGPFRAITPWEYGANRTSQKQLARYRAEINDANASGLAVKVYYQLDDGDKSADTFSTGCAKGTGAWTTAGILYTGSAGNTGTIDSNGNGAVWYEFDGTTSYNNGVGTLAKYPSYRRIRWMFEINGDTSGTLVPTLIAMAWQRIEYPRKYYLFSIRLRIQMDDSQSGTGLYHTYADVRNAITTLETLANAKTVFTYVDPYGASHTVVITKIVENAIVKDDNGTKVATVDLSMQEVNLVGQQV